MYPIDPLVAVVMGAVLPQKTYLLCATLDHGVDGHADETRRDAFTAVGLAHREHGNVASQRPASMRFQLGHHDADKTVIGTVQRLFLRCLAGRRSAPPGCKSGGRAGRGGP